MDSGDIEFIHLPQDETKWMPLDNVQFVIFASEHGSQRREISRSPQPSFQEGLCSMKLC
jgi:hypothetical protein